MTTTDTAKNVIESSLPADLELSVREEVSTIEPGPLPQTEDMATLYRVLRLRGRLVAEAARVREMTEQMIRNLEGRVSAIDYVYTPLLAEVVRNELARTRAKVKSLKTPFGVAGFRKQAMKLEVIDEAKVIGAGYVRQPSPQVDREALGRHFKMTGEIPAGCDVIPETENFYLKT